MIILHLMAISSVCIVFYTFLPRPTAADDFGFDEDQLF
jgi:hypothetical protein